MANNASSVDGLKVAVVKLEELKTSAKGKPYLRMNLVHEDAGEKTWFTGVAFGTVATALSRKLAKGNRMKVNGSVSQKEYTKKDGQVGVENNLIINSAIVSNGTTVEVVDDFSV
jgi:single-stranded DNA-binding protein